MYRIDKITSSLSGRKRGNFIAFGEGSLDYPVSKAHQRARTEDGGKGQRTEVRGRGSEDR